MSEYLDKLREKWVDRILKPFIDRLIAENVLAPYPSFTVDWEDGGNVPADHRQGQEYKSCTYGN